MKITRETKVLFYNTQQEIYEVRKFKAWHDSRTPVCTVRHFMHVMATFFEYLHPTIGENPLYQDIDWSVARENELSEMETSENVKSYVHKEKSKEVKT